MPPSPLDKPSERAVRRHAVAGRAGCVVPMGPARAPDFHAHAGEFRPLSDRCAGHPGPGALLDTRAPLWGNRRTAMFRPCQRIAKSAGREVRLPPGGAVARTGATR
jgi:hypothetical protein